MKNVIDYIHRNPRNKLIFSKSKEDIENYRRNRTANRVTGILFLVKISD
jgi:hypothetical protein